MTFACVCANEGTKFLFIRLLIGKKKKRERGEDETILLGLKGGSCVCAYGLLDEKMKKRNKNIKKK